jgi:copper(I)-binding protein
VSGFKRFTIWAALVGVATGGVACETATGPPGILVEDAWARPAEAGGTTAVYFRVTNSGGEPDRLLGAETGFAQAAEFHQTAMEGDMVHMMAVSGIDVGPGETIVLEPGGLHLMLAGLVEQGLQPGDVFRITLVFESGEVPVDIQVAEP